MGRIILFILGGITSFYSIQPRKLQLVWGKVLGALLYHLKIRRNVVEQNLQIAYPGDWQKQKAVAYASYGELGNLVFEILMLLGPLQKFVVRSVDVAGLENWREAHRQGRGVIFLTSHLGNWEVMAAAGALIAQIDLLMVTKRLKPAWLHQAIEEGRLRCGVKATYEPRTYRDILAHLKKNGTLGFVMDQYAGPPVGVRVPVFGVPVGTPLIVATLVKRTGALIVPVANYRKPDGRWAIEIQPALEWIEDSNLHQELAKNTAEYTKVLEKSILAHPEQWLWTHRRFKGDMSPLRDDEWGQPRVRR